MLMGQRANPLLVIVGGRKEEVTMPLYMTQFAYTPEAWAALVDNPEDRSAPVRELTEAMGGRVIGWYLSFDEYSEKFIPNSSLSHRMGTEATGKGVTRMAAHRWWLTHA